VFVIELTIRLLVPPFAFQKTAGIVFDFHCRGDRI